MKESEIEKSKYFEGKIYPSGYPNIQKLRLYLVPIFNEKYNYFLRYLVLFWAKKSPEVKDQGVRGQVSTTFSKAPQCGLTFGAKILVVADGNLACPFFCFQTHFFDFESFFWCHAPKREKNQLIIMKENFMLEISKKKIFKNLQEQKSWPDPEYFWWRHQ